MQTQPKPRDVLKTLSEHGYQVTPQRRYVVEQCLDTDGHFTAEDLFERDHPEGVGLSRATVYNTLHLLVEIDFLRELSDMGNSSYYEVNDQLHPHAHCRVCGDLIDIPVNLEDQVDAWDLPFEVESIRMTVDGICPDCEPTPTP